MHLINQDLRLAKSEIDALKQAAPKPRDEGPPVSVSIAPAVEVALAVQVVPPPPVTAPVQPVPAPSRPLQPTPSMSLEERVAYWGARIDALALLVGASYGFKYAVDNAWIGPSARIACGVLAGLAMLVAAEVTRARTQKTWTQVALGAGISLLFVSAYASHAYYHLLPAAAGDRKSVV